MVIGKNLASLLKILPGPPLEKEGELAGPLFLKGDSGGFFERLQELMNW